MNFVYPNVHSVPSPPPEYFLNRMILTSRNSDVNVNETLLNRMAGNSKTYYSADQVIHKAGTDSYNDLPLTPEFLQSITLNSLPPGELRIKIGCPLILLQNLSPSNGLCNGTCMVVIGMSERVLQVQLFGGNHDGQHALIPQISLIPTSTPQFTFKIRHCQFPVRFTFAVSINCAQGQSVKHVRLDLQIPVFTHGQLYITLSCVIARQNLRVLLPEDTSLHPKTKNVIYKEALL